MISLRVLGTPEGKEIEELKKAREELEAKIEAERARAREQERIREDMEDRLTRMEQMLKAKIFTADAILEKRDETP